MLYISHFQGLQTHFLRRRQRAKGCSGRFRYIHTHIEVPHLPTGGSLRKGLHSMCRDCYRDYEVILGAITGFMWGILSNTQVLKNNLKFVLLGWYSYVGVCISLPMLSWECGVNLRSPSRIPCNSRHFGSQP